MKNSTKKDFNLNVDEMAGAGLFVGHKTSKTHPKMKPFISWEKNTICMIDLEKTKEKFEEALEFIKNISSEGKTILFVGTKIQAKEEIKKTAEECKMPYINIRWLGGTFTNFPIIKKRIEYFKSIEKKKETGDLEKYTKKERLEFDREIQKLEQKFGGIKKMDKIPEAIFILDIDKENSALKEAKAMGVKTIAVIDTNADPNLVDFPIPANDDSVSSISYILKKIEEVILQEKPKDK